MSSLNISVMHFVEAKPWENDASDENTNLSAHVGAADAEATLASMASARYDRLRLVF